MRFKDTLAKVGIAGFLGQEAVSVPATSLTIYANWDIALGRYSRGARIGNKY